MVFDSRVVGNRWYLEVKKGTTGIQHVGLIFSVTLGAVIANNGK